MGEICAAAVFAHAPAIMAPEPVRKAIGMTGEDVLIVGATGQVGGLVARHLFRTFGLRCRGLVRRRADPEPTTFTSIVGDLDDPRSLTRAVAGCRAIFVASSLHPDQRELQVNLLRAAERSGSHPRLVKLSGLSTRIDSRVDSGRWHAEIEREMSASGLPTIALRPHFFMQSLRPAVQLALRSGTMNGPEEGRVAMVDVRDVAEVAAELLIRDFDGYSAITLTGDIAHSFRDVARLAREVTGIEIEFSPRSEDEVRGQLEVSQMPPWRVDLLCQFNRAFAAGEAERVTDDVERVLGRPPRTLRDVLPEFVS